jgi:hypothetical protein
MIRGDVIDRKARRRIESAGWAIRREQLHGSPAQRFIASKTIAQKNEEGDIEQRQLFESDYTLDGLSAIVARREREERDFGGRVMAS